MPEPQNNEAIPRRPRVSEACLLELAVLETTLPPLSPPEVEPSGAPPEQEPSAAPEHSERA